jgi:putative ABC transport system ATP-binding protein
MQSTASCSALNQPATIKLVISVRHLNRYFGQGELRKQTLFDINLDIYPGEITIVTGPSGSGKTTLLSPMGGLRSAQEGSLRILGQQMQGVSKQQMMQVRRQIGCIFPAHNLLTFLTGEQNVRMSLELHDECLEQDMDGMLWKLCNT